MDVIVGGNGGQVVVGVGGQHSAHQIGGGNVGGSLDHNEAASVLDGLVAVVSVLVGGDVVSVDHVLALVVVHHLGVGNVGGLENRFGGPLASFDRQSSLGQMHHHGALVLGDILVRVHSYVQFVAELSSLSHGTGMACVSWNRGVYQLIASGESDRPSVVTTVPIPALRHVFQHLHPGG